MYMYYSQRLDAIERDDIESIVGRSNYSRFGSWLYFRVALDKLAQAKSRIHTRVLALCERVFIGVKFLRLILISVINAMPNIYYI